MFLKNKNILVTGVGKGLGKNMVESFVKSGAFVYGVTRSRSDINKLKNLKNLKVYLGDVRNIKLINKIFKAGYELYFPDRTDDSTTSSLDLLQQFE